jgi:hypothetical protein
MVKFRFCIVTVKFSSRQAIDHILNGMNVLLSYTTDKEILTFPILNKLQGILNSIVVSPEQIKDLFVINFNISASDKVCAVAFVILNFFEKIMHRIQENASLLFVVSLSI